MINLLKLILLWWIISVVVRWYRRRFSERGPRKSEDLWGDEKAGRHTVPPRDDDPASSDRVYSGKRGPRKSEDLWGDKIEDAEFEDIDDQNSKSS